MSVSVNDISDQMDREIEVAVEALRMAIISNFKYIGEQCVNEARSNHRYLNQTGNLCSSIGYGIVENGQFIIERWYDKSAGEGGSKVGTGGKGRGIEYLHSLQSECADSEKIYLILVAGMPYASYVEDMGLNVLDSAGNLMESLVEKLKRKIFK